jgi:hypothetical protein
MLSRKHDEVETIAVSIRPRDAEAQARSLIDESQFRQFTSLFGPTIDLHHLLPLLEILPL